MAKNKFISLLLCITLIISLLPLPSAAALSTKDKIQRRVYVHAFDETRSNADTTYVKQIKKGEETKIYFAVDDPNKADSSAADKQWEQQFNLGGFTVKIIYDTKYFDLADPADFSPIEYDFVESIRSDSSASDLDTVDSSAMPDGFSDTLSYTSLGQGTHISDGDASAKYGYAYASILYKGGTLSETADTIGNWYNLAYLPLKAKETGRTSVKIEIDSDDPYTLELFAKNVPHSDVDNDGVDDIEVNFDYVAENGGVFHLDIVDETKPEPPFPNPPASTYVGTQHVKLSSLEAGDIYYTTSSDISLPKEEFELYDASVDSSGIPIVFSQDIRCYLVRQRDGRESNIATYRYQILPPAPRLFNSAKEFISPQYTEPWSDSAAGYHVYASDSGDVNNPLTGNNFIYYTFTKLDPGLITDDPANPYVGNDADKAWVRITSGSGLVPDVIDCMRTIRLVAVKNNEHSDVAAYELGVKPGKVTATPDSHISANGSVAVSLESVAPSSAQIYYVRNDNDGDPRVDGTLYEGPLTLNYDTTIRAAAKYNGQWGDVSSFWYRFDNGITAFYPPGKHEGSVDVSLFPKEEGQKIEVKIGDGSWQPYTSPIRLDVPTDIRARIDGAVTDGILLEYDVHPLPPVFAPESIQFTQPDWVSIYAPESTSATTQNFSILYTTDGSDPVTSPTANTAPSSQYDAVKDEVRIYITSHTEVKAVVVKEKDGKKYYSDVVTHTYELVTDRPSTPVTTVKPGYHTHPIGGDPIETLFEKVADGTQIYYTISTGDAYVPDPEPNEAGNGITHLYSENSPLEIKGNTVIKAVAVTYAGGAAIKSNIGVYTYTVSPEAPVSMQSGDITDYESIPVDAVSGEGCFVEYEINGVQGRFENKDGERFYIDTKTGNAYRNCVPTQGEQPLCKLDLNIVTPVTLKLRAILDGVASAENSYLYTVVPDSQLVAPYADKQSGTYDESDGEFNVSLYSIYTDNSDVKIQWRYQGQAAWNDYSTISFATVDKVLEVRTVSPSTGKASKTVSYAYYFAPPAPAITKPSGVYSGANLKTDVLFPAQWLKDGKHTLYIQFSEDGHFVPLYRDLTDIAIDESMSIKAFIKNEYSGRISDVVSAYYLLRESSEGNGRVYILAPYNVDIISAHLLGTGLYAEGIKLDRLGTGIIKYQWCYKLKDGSWTAWTDVLTYDPINPIVPTSRMDKVRVLAWIDGDYDATYIDEEIDFVHLGKPTVRLEASPDADGNYQPNTGYWVQNEHKDLSNVVVFYTANGNDPVTDIDGRKHFNSSPESAKEQLAATTTVKAVYFYACGRCEACNGGNPHNCGLIREKRLYGETAVFTYPVKTVVHTGGGGGGGGGNKVVDNTREYTVDIFGIEHPTHISYINGYPDGSVRPDGNITREEISAILYRIKPMAYDKPVETTGEVFPDVSIDRWSVREIEHLSGYGIIEGYPDGTFRPSGNLTRAEFAALIRRFIKSAVIKTANKRSELVDIDGHWAYDDISFIAKAGLIDGYEDGTFRPDREITRAEVMSVINRILGRKPLESYVKSLHFSPFNDLEANKWHYVTVLEATITHDYYLNSQKFEHKWENWK